MIDADTSLSPAFRVPSMDYFDLHADYQISSGLLDGLSFGIGVENLTDKDPPILASPVNANTDASQYDVLGRRYYVSLNYSF